MSSAPDSSDHHAAARVTAAIASRSSQSESAPRRRVADPGWLTTCEFRQRASFRSRANGSAGAPVAHGLPQVPVPRGDNHRHRRRRRCRYTSPPRSVSPGPSHAPSAPSNFTSPAPMPPKREGAMSSAAHRPAATPVSATRRATLLNQVKSEGRRRTTKVSQFGMRRVRRSNAHANDATDSAAWTVATASRTTPGGTAPRRPSRRSPGRIRRGHPSGDQTGKRRMPATAITPQQERNRPRSWPASSTISRTMAS